MKSYHLFFLLLLVLTSCDNDETPPSKTLIDKEFQEYFDAFIEETESRAPNSTIDFSDFIIRFANPGELDTGVLGRCPKIGGHEIIIAKNDWEGLDSVYREALIFHELGHCALSRFHDGETLRWYNCKSIMTSVIDGANCGIDYYSPMWREYYLQELFGLATEPFWIHVDTAYYLQNPMTNFFESNNLYAEITGLDNEDYQVELFFDSMTTTSFKIGDFKMEFEYNGWGQANGKAKLYLNDKLFIQYPFLNGIDWQPSMPLRFTFRFMKGQVFIFINGRLIHNREAEAKETINTAILQGSELFEKVVASRLN